MSLRLLCWAFLAFAPRAFAEPPSKAPVPEQVKRGEQLYTQNVCSACHSVDGSPRAAPSFKGLFGRKQKLQDGSWVVVDASHLRASILEPGQRVTAGFQPIMPSYQGRLKPEEVEALIAFIESLR